MLLTNTYKRGRPMAKPNFQFQKRQKELEKKKKNEEKMQRKLEKSNAAQTEGEDQPEEDAGDAEESTP
jgi:hypothetical protein